jgi:hypothetical protein
MAQSSSLDPVPLIVYPTNDRIRQDAYHADHISRSRHAGYPIRKSGLGYPAIGVAAPSESHAVHWEKPATNQAP